MNSDERLIVLYTLQKEVFKWQIVLPNKSGVNSLWHFMV
jgi:hypothetical protein